MSRERSTAVDWSSFTIPAKHSNKTRYYKSRYRLQHVTLVNYLASLLLLICCDSKLLQNANDNCHKFKWAAPKAADKRMLCSTVHAVALLWWCNRLTSHISSWEPLIRGFSAQSQRTATQRRIHYGRAATGCRLNSDIAVPCISSKNHALEGILQLGEGEAGLGLTAPATQHQLVPVATITRREQKFQRP